MRRNYWWSMVTTLDGEELGRILDLEIDSQSHVVFAIVVQNGFDEFPGLIPFCTFEEENGKFFLLLGRATIYVIDQLHR